MLFSKALALGVALLTSLVVADTDIDIDFHKWDGDHSDCSGDEVGEEKRLHDMHCQTMDHYFKGFKFKPSRWMAELHIHDDYTTPGCKVIVYPEDECKGVGYAPGDATLTYYMCWQVPDFLGSGEMQGYGKSVGVWCSDDQSEWAGLKELVRPDSLEYKEYEDP